MANERRCSRTGCIVGAVATLTYVYRDSTVVIGPLATASEPHSYDLCAAHASRLTAPRGWEVVRADGEFVPAPVVDDLTALAEAVREATAADDPAADGQQLTGAGMTSAGVGSAGELGGGPELARRGHLRVLPRPEA